MFKKKKIKRKDAQDYLFKYTDGFDKTHYLVAKNWIEVVRKIDKSRFSKLGKRIEWMGDFTQ